MGNITKVVSDYYSALGIPSTASQRQVQSAFRKLAQKHHPDTNKDPKSIEKFKRISEAYAVLSDSKKRQEYDQAQAVPESSGSNSSSRSSSWPSGFQPTSTDPDDLGVIFESWHRQQMRPLVRLAISLVTAYRGGVMQATMPDRSQINLSIPAGTIDGMVFEAGNFDVQIEILPNPRFAQEGLDLVTEIELALKIALLGGDIDVDTLKPRKVKLSIPSGTQNGTKLRLRGLGFPSLRGERAGDLYVKINVRLPRVTEEIKNWAQKMP